MKPVLIPQGVKNIDEACVREAGISVHELMENAARSASDIVLSRFPDRRKIVILCGNGNNGGDGFAMARMLSEVHDVHVAANPVVEKMSDATRVNYLAVCDVLPMISISMAYNAMSEFDIVIDAVFGVGFKGTLAETDASWLNNISSPYKIAVDVPSGLNALTGEADVNAFRADLTITMEGIKLGMMLGKGRAICGEIVVVPIGAPQDVVSRYATAWVLETSDIRSLLPFREAETSKFDYGRVLVIAGSYGMRGAAATAHAALRAGAGLVELATPMIHPLLPREVITIQLPSTEDGFIAPTAREKLVERIQRASVVVIGPGIGDKTEMIQMLATVAESLDHSVPLVVDADGLRMFPMLKKSLDHCILTPHHGEYQHISPTHANADSLTVLERIEDCKSFAKHTGSVLHLKSYPSITTDGDKVFLTPGGNPGMATAGAGDVLTGMISALCAQHVPLLESAALASFLHAAAGDSVAARIAQESLIAGDLIEEIGNVIPN